MCWDLLFLLRISYVVSTGGDIILALAFLFMIYYNPFYGIAMAAHYRWEVDIVAYDYGYGNLENKLIELFLSGAPDFDAAEELMRHGADINAIGRHDDENILSEILNGYWYSDHGDTVSAVCANRENDHRDDCEYDCNLDSGIGPSMCAIIRFFLDHGYDVTKRDGCFGAQCLWSLTLSTFDRYMIEATKILLDAGAKNRTISPTSTDADETPWSFIAAEGGFRGTCEHDYSSANIYETVYQIYKAVEDGKPYNGIDSYEIAIGKKIQKILAERSGNDPIFFSLALPEFKKDSCYNQTLYFVYDGGVLISNQYADFWTDTVFPDADLIDVSEHFDGIVGNTIQRFMYDHKLVAKGTMHYDQPIIMMEMDSGHKVRFSINFGEVKEEERAAYYEILNGN